VAKISPNFVSDGARYFKPWVATYHCKYITYIAALVVYRVSSFGTPFAEEQVMPICVQFVVGHAVCSQSLSG
jgi:hypothetical protein